MPSNLISKLERINNILYIKERKKQMKILASDGKEFKTTDECVAYEKEQQEYKKAAEEKAKKLKEEKQNREDEIAKKEKELIDLKQSYFNDYHKPFVGMRNLISPLDEIFEGWF